MKLRARIKKFFFETPLPSDYYVIRAEIWQEYDIEPTHGINRLTKKDMLKVKTQFHLAQIISFNDTPKSHRYNPDDHEIIVELSTGRRIVLAYSYAELEKRHTEYCRNDK